MFYANLSILFIGLIETKTILYLLKIPFQFLAPMILLLSSIGSYIGRGLVLDVMIMFGAGIIGFLLRRSGYSIPGIVLGIILGKIGEQNFAQGMQMVHYDIIEYLSRPICLLLISIIFPLKSTALIESKKNGEISSDIKDANAFINWVKSSSFYDLTYNDNNEAVKMINEIL